MPGTPTEETMPDTSTEETIAPPPKDDRAPTLAPAEGQLHSRLTVVEMVYHSLPGSSPETMLGDGSRFGRELVSDEEPYTRHKVATELWQPLDCGWVDRCGQLLLRNDEGKFSVIPTDARRAEVAQRVLEITFTTLLNQTMTSRDVWLVPPGESMRAYPAEAKGLSIRCRQGSAKYTLCLIPE